MIALVYTLLLIVALLLVWQSYGNFRRIGPINDDLGWRISIGDVCNPKWFSVALSWERYPVRTPLKPEAWMEKGAKFLGWHPALVVRWLAFRLVILGRLKGRGDD